MRIENIYALQGINRPINNVSQRRDGKETIDRKDAYLPSAFATEYNIARRAAMAQPDVRADRINDIASRMDTGQYNISALEVARKIVSQA